MPVLIVPEGQEDPATGRGERIVVAIDASAPDAPPGPEETAVGPER